MVVLSIVSKNGEPFCKIPSLVAILLEKGSDA